MKLNNNQTIIDIHALSPNFKLTPKTKNPKTTIKQGKRFSS